MQFKTIQYVDSSEDDSSHEPKLNQPASKQTNQHATYQHILSEIIQAQADTCKKNQMQIHTNHLKLLNTNADIDDHLKRKNNRYLLLHKQIHNDQNYQLILQGKVNRLKEINSKKIEKLINKQHLQELKEEERQLEKYYLDRQCKQQINLNKINKNVHKLAIEDFRSREAAIKTKFANTKQATEKYLDSMSKRQRNQIEKLKEEIRTIKENEALNRKEERKVVTELLKQNLSIKQNLRNKLIAGKQK